MTENEYSLNSFRWLLHAGLVGLPDFICERINGKQVKVLQVIQPEIEKEESITLSIRERDKINRFITPRIKAGYEIKDIYQLMIAAGILPKDAEGEFLKLSTISDMAKQIKKEIENENAA